MRFVSLCLIVLACFGPALRAAAPSKPNILLILADDMGYSDLGCYGSEIATPHLDALAKNGLRFTQFYNTARCWPTRGAVVTGYYAQQIRRDGFANGRGGGNRGTRPAWAPLLATLLQPHGYRSYHSGKWHIDGLPLQNGFDRSYSLDDHDRYFAPRRHTEDDKPLPPADASYRYTTTYIADHAIKSLQEHAAKYSSQPFFEFLCFTAPHFPLHALPEDIAKYKDTYSRGWDVMRQERWQRMQKLGLMPTRTTLASIEREVGPPYHFPEAIEKLGPNDVNRPVPWTSLTPAQRELQAAKMAVHAAMVDRMDREIGRVLDQLRTMGALENTLIFFLSDNGASAEMMVRGDGHDQNAAPGSAATFLSLGPGWSSVANTPFRRHKTWVHEGGISTPLIVHWPAGIKARGELRQQPAHLIDIVPTVFDALQISPTKASADAPARPGLSLVPSFAADTARNRDPIWFLHEGNRALRAGDWKLVAAANQPWELYNLADDRAETRNLAATQPEKVRELETKWNAMTAEHQKWAEKDAPPEPAPKKKRDPKK